MIEVKNLTKTFEDGVSPFKNISFNVDKGEVVVLIGPSGTGKSTLLRCINALEKPTKGQIIIDGVDITDKKSDINEVRKNVGMVFQSFNLFPHLTIIENIMKPQMDILKRNKQEAYDKALELLKIVGLLDKSFNYPDELSGGQKQRIAIARSLAMDSEYILFDEPTSALDPTMVLEVQAVIKKLATLGKTMIIVTHEMKFAKEIGTRIIFMADSSIIEDGTPKEVFDHPKSLKAKRFINKIKFIEFNINNKNYDILSTFTAIEKFALDIGISKKVKNKVISCYEELVVNTLFTKINGFGNIQVSFDYNEEENIINMHVSYPSIRKYNPLLNKDELPIIIFKMNVKSSKYSYKNDNVIDCKICE